HRHDHLRLHRAQDPRRGPARRVAVLPAPVRRALPQHARRTSRGGERAAVGDVLTRVSALSEHPHFIPRLADAFAVEWPGWAAKVGRSGVEDIFRETPGSTLPVILVAHAAG